MGHQHGITGAYADNISIVGSSSLAVQQARDSISTRFEKDDIPLTWSADSPSTVLDTIGVILDFEKAVARNKPRRLWGAFLAGQAILRKSYVIYM